MQHFFLRTGLLAAATILVTAANISAQLPQPRLDRVFPLGGEAGSEVTVQIAGKDLDEAKTLRFDHPGLRAEYIKENEFRVHIAPDTPLGTHEVRALGKHGLSGSRLFMVSAGLASVREVEPNDSLDKAQAVPMNVAIDGSSDANGYDFFRFPARKEQRLTVECQAFRLDSQLRPVLTLLTAQGQELAQGVPYYGHRDPLLDFLVPADGDYVLRLNDLTFTGDQPYRLLISTRPRIYALSPLAVVPGQQAELKILGMNLPGGEWTQEVSTGGHRLQQLRIPVGLPKQSAARPGLDFIDHVSAASLNTRGIEIWPQGISHCLNPALLACATDPITEEHESNDTPATAQAVTLPTVICGRWDRPGDVDWYSFQAKAGDKAAVDLVCDRLNSQGDALIVITDANGNELETFDDQGQSDEALLQLNRDPVGVFTAPADGTYRLSVEERYRRGGPRYTYALRLGKARPDFFPVVYHEGNDPTCPILRQGGSAFFEFCLNRRDGLDGAVTVEAEGLPARASPARRSISGRRWNSAPWCSAPLEMRRPGTARFAFALGPWWEASALSARLLASSGAGRTAATAMPRGPAGRFA
jgi:hypothetical protein